jgi:hypothetical protein
VRLPLIELGTSAYPSALATALAITAAKVPRSIPRSAGWCRFEEGAASLVVGHCSLLNNTARHIEVARDAMVEALRDMRSIVLCLFVCCWVSCDATRRPQDRQKKEIGSFFHRRVMRDRVFDLDEESRKAHAFMESLRLNEVHELSHYMEPKLVEISEPQKPQIQQIFVPPSLDELRERVTRATFTGKGDHAKVIEMLDDFDNLMSGRPTRAELQKRKESVWGWTKPMKALRDRMRRSSVEPVVSWFMKREARSTSRKRVAPEEIRSQQGTSSALAAIQVATPTPTSWP